MSKKNLTSVKRHSDNCQSGSGYGASNGTEYRGGCGNNKNSGIWYSLLKQNNFN